MKTKMIAFLMVLLLIVLAGCNNTPSNEDKPQPFSSSESSQSSTESETPVENEKKEVETTPVAVQESEPEKQEETTEKKTVNSERLRLFLKPSRRYSPPHSSTKRIRPRIPYQNHSRIFPKKVKRLCQLKQRKRQAKPKSTSTLITGFPLRRITLKALDFSWTARRFTVGIIRSVPERIVNILKEIFTAA